MDVLFNGEIIEILQAIKKMNEKTQEYRESINQEFQ